MTHVEHVHDTFVPMNSTSKATDVAKLFFKHMAKYWGLPLNIVSDRDTRFTGKFWPALFKLVGMQLLTSLGFHPEKYG